MKLTRAMMMFGGPPHRLQSQIMSAARVLDIQLSALYLPDVVLLSFDDSGTGTSHIKLIRQGSALNIEKLTDAFCLYWKVRLLSSFVDDVPTDATSIDRSSTINCRSAMPPLLWTC